MYINKTELQSESIEKITQACDSIANYILSNLIFHNIVWKQFNIDLLMRKIIQKDFCFK